MMGILGLDRIPPDWARMLLTNATEALRHSYSPYSHFPVGAAVLAESGQVYTGTNIENTSYGLTICAERAAVFSAVSHGERKIVGLAAVAAPNGVVQTCFPCGACRQVMAEFFKERDLVSCVTFDEDGEIVCFTMEQLLPRGFNLESYPMVTPLK